MPARLFCPEACPADAEHRSDLRGALGQWLTMPDGEVGHAPPGSTASPTGSSTVTRYRDDQYPSRQDGVEKWWPLGRYDEFGAAGRQCRTVR